MIATIDIAWLAGLLEGEGSFTWSYTPQIQLQMTDRDIVERAAKLLGVGLRNPWMRKDGYQTVWSCVPCGSTAISWMMTLFPLMGERRQAKIRELLTRWNKAPDMPRAPRGQRWMATCHPDKPRQGKGLCNSCYMRIWRSKTNYYERRKSLRNQAKVAIEAPKSTVNDSPVLTLIALP